MTTSGKIDWLIALLSKLGVCGSAGVGVGAMSGFTLSLLDVTEESVALRSAEALQIWLLLAVFGWLALLGIFTLFVRFTARSVAGPALVSSVLVTGLTVLLTWLTGSYGLAWLFGILVGALVGVLLCQAYRRVTGGHA